MELKGKQDGEALSSVQTQIRQGRSRRSYREFLRKFTVLKEELLCDYDEFDLNYYTYGLRLYKNMPLIEPLETREIMKISEFVIVIDTSYSTQRSAGQTFSGGNVSDHPAAGQLFPKKPYPDHSM